MKSRLLILAMMLGVIATGCSRKTAPTISFPNPCDSTIQALIDSIKTNSRPAFAPLRLVNDTICEPTECDCSYYVQQALEIADKYNDAIQQLKYQKTQAEKYKEQAGKKSPRRVVNNININSKNKDTQIGESNVQQTKPKGPAINGEGNVGQTKPKGPSIVGDGNTQDNRKGSIWPWILLGAGAMWILQNVVWRWLKGTSPILKATSLITKLFT